MWVEIGGDAATGRHQLVQAVAFPFDTWNVPWLVEGGGRARDGDEAGPHVGGQSGGQAVERAVEGDE